MSIDDSDAALRIVEAGRRRVHTRLHDAFARQIAGHTDLGEIDPDVLERLVSESADRAGASLWRIALAEGAADEFGVSIGEALAHPAVNAAEQLIGPPAEPLPAPNDAGLPPEALRTGAEPPGDAGLPPETLRTGAEPAGDEPIPAGWEGTTQAEIPAEAADPWPIPDVAGMEETPVAEPATPVEPEPEPEPEPESEPEPEPEPAPPRADATTGPSAIRIAAVHTGGIESLKEGEKDLELRLSDAGLDVIKASTGIAIGRLDWTEITSVEIAAARRGLRRRAATLEVRTGRGQATFELPALTEEETTEHLEPMLDRLRASGALASSGSEPAASG